MKVTMLRQLCIVALLVVAVLAQSDVVVTKSGPVRGVLADNARKFLGIPFAAPPIGELRWADPKPVTAWSPKVFDATSFAPGCPQVCELPPLTCPNVTSEDCLTLNVFTPRSASGPLPVMVYLPGGRFEQGAAGIDLYDSSIVANTTSTVIVTASYRFGALGYLYIDGVGTNFGLKDQLFALQWVQDNIAAFGGDPKQVTLYGQSAGATSTSVLLSVPSIDTLISKAIIQSNPLALPLRTVSSAKSLAEYFSKALGCSNNDVACYRSKSADDIVTAQHAAQQHIPIIHPLVSFLPWSPVIDQQLVFEQPLEAYAHGRFAAVPTIIGTVADEALLFVWQAWNKTLSKLDYDAVIVGIFREHALGVIDLYHDTDAADARPILARLGTDYIFLCPTRNSARALAAKSRTYLYRFNHTMSFPGAWGPRFWYCDTDVVCHGSELPFVFYEHGPFEWQPDEAQLSREMIAYWTNFAHTGDPNKGPSAVAVQWPAVNADRDSELMFSTQGNSVEESYRSKYCDVWDRFGYNF